MGTKVVDQDTARRCHEAIFHHGTDAFVCFWQPTYMEHLGQGGPKGEEWAKAPWKGHWMIYRAAEALAWLGKKAK